MIEISMMSFRHLILVFAVVWPSISTSYGSCSDPDYVKYVSKRISFYEKLDREDYEEAQIFLESTPFETLTEDEKERYLYGNTIHSARFDSIEVAIRNVRAYESLPSPFFRLMDTGDRKHKINIARGWIALNSGEVAEATKYLLISADTKSSPVLASFGPDKTLIRELYKLGEKSAVLEYLKLVTSFWNTDNALEFIETWKTMIAHDCPIQFQYYDKESLTKLGLKIGS